MRPSAARLRVIVLGSVAAVTVVAPLVPAEARVPRCNGEQATIVGDAGGNRLDGTAGRDVIVGGRGNDTIDGRGGRDLICGGGANDIVSGGRGADVIYGGAGIDVIGGDRGRDALYGGRDHDVIAGGPGSDRISGGAATDILVPGPGWDAVFGGRGKDVVDFARAKRGVVVDLARGTAKGEGRDRLRSIAVVAGSKHADRLAGTTGRDALSGGEGDDRLFGKGGRDLLAPGGGRDVVYGGRARDTATYIFEKRGVRVHLARPRPDHFSSIEVLQGSLFSDTLIGTRRPDQLEGLTGSDRLVGRGGNDLLRGGDGDDYFVGGAGDDALRGGPGHDRLDHSATSRAVTVDFASGTATGDGIDTFDDIHGFIGSEFADRAFGSDAYQSFELGSGDDLVAAAAGNDDIEGGPGADDIDGGDGSDEIYGDEGDDSIIGGDGNDTIYAGEGGHRINGGPGNDEISGGTGNDRVEGDADDDRIEPHSGDDVVDGGSGTDFVGYDSADSGVQVDVAAGTATGDGNDTIVAIENIGGSERDDILSGDDGPNVIEGEYGGGQVSADEMYGRGGNDVLQGLGDDFAHGGPDSDSCSHSARYEDCELISPPPPPLSITRPQSTPSPSSSPSFAPRSGVSTSEPSASSSHTYQVDAAHRGYVASSTLVPPLDRAWERDLGDTVSYPVIADARVFVVAGDFREASTLYALDGGTGATLWSRTTEGESAVSYDSGRLYWSDTKGNLRALDPATGTTIWDAPLPFGLYSDAPPTVAGGVVYLDAGAGGGGLYAVAAADGEFLWGRGFISGGPSAPAAANGRAYVAYSGPQVLSYASDATLLWRFAGCCTGGGGVAPVLHEGRLYAHGIGITTAGFVLDANSGEERGYFFSDRTPAFAGPTGIFLRGPALEAWDIYGGGRKWSFEGDGGLASPPLIVGDYVYVGSFENRLFAVDRDLGRAVWESELPGPATQPTFERLPLPGLGASEDLLVVPAGTHVVAFR